jgi:hypothetical protein
MSAGDPESASTRTEARFVRTSVGIFIGLTGVLFWRYAAAPGAAVSDPGDPAFLMWTMEWVQHALLHSPANLFDAPIFHPFKGTLAYSDPLFPQSLVALPLRLLGFGPVAAYNFVYLAGIVSAGVLTALLFLRITGDPTAALFGAAVATFPATRLFHLAHMQLQVTTFWPLVFLCVHRLLSRPRPGATLALSLSVVAMVLGSLYFGMFLALLLPPVAFVAWLVRRERSWAALGSLCVAGVLAVGALLPVAKVYSRSLEHLGQERGEPGFSDLSDFLAVSHFADVGGLFPAFVVRDASPQWVGGGAAWLLPLSLVVAASLLLRDALRRRAVRMPEWVRQVLPYAVLGCLALALTLGPDVRWRGSVLAGNPIGRIATLPGVDKIRDFQRAGFVVAFAGGAVVAIGLAALSHRRRRVRALALTFVGVTTLTPAFSSSLPAYRPPPFEAMSPAYAWVKREPRPIVLFEVPLPRRDELEPFTYLWAALHHKKRLVHGFSGYLPLTDEALRDESTRVHRADFFRALAVVGATHVVVHTKALEALPGGAASLRWLREVRGGDRVARFADAEVYLVERQTLPQPRFVKQRAEAPEFSVGGISTERCVDIGKVAPPLLLYLPTATRVSGLRFVAESPLGALDDALVVERSSDLQWFRRVPHAPLLSASLATYLERPTSRLWTPAALPPEKGSFIRLSSRQGEQLRLCELMVEFIGSTSTERVRPTEMGVETGTLREIASLAIDGDTSTRWHSGALQRGGEWIDLDLGRKRKVSAVLAELGEFSYDFGRRVALDCQDVDASFVGAALDGQVALLRRPRVLQVVPFGAPGPCRRLRLRQTGQASENFWSVAELAVLVESSVAPR